jgi:type II secretory pathway pseudopilin PulG
MDRGFTLIEVLVSATILILVFSAISSLVIFSLRQADRLESLLSSQYLLQARLEEIRTLPFADLPALDGRSFDGGKGLIKTSNVASDLILVELNHDVSISTLRSRY